jgi:hypothetical protein
MEQEPTKEEIERRAGELARRVMAKPPEPRSKPKPKMAKGRASPKAANGKEVAL